MQTIGQVIHFFLRIFQFVIIIHAFLTFFMSPYHPIRQRLDRFLEPIYAPIRRMIGRFVQTGPLDFSPIVLLILIFILDQIVINLFR